MLDSRPKTLAELGYCISEEYAAPRTPEIAAIAEIAAKLPKKLYKVLSEEEILAMQAPSTRSKLMGTYDKDFPNHQDWKANKDATTIDEAVGMGIRLLSPEETEIFNRNRKGNKNQRGQTGFTSKERKEKGTSAFLASPGKTFKQLSPEEQTRLMLEGNKNMEKIEEPSLPEKQKPKWLGMGTEFSRYREFTNYLIAILSAGATLGAMGWVAYKLFWMGVK